MKNTELLNELESYISKFRKQDTQAGESLGVDTRLLTYGSTPYETFHNLIKNTSIKPRRFIVVGCSTGWMNFYWNELYPNIKTIGIDIHPYRLEFGNKLIKDYSLNNIELKNCSLYDFEFQNEDLIWQSNLCFPQEEVYKINEKIIEETPNVTIISYRPISRKTENSYFIKPYYYPASWTERQPFHIYEKL